MKTDGMITEHFKAKNGLVKSDDERSKIDKKNYELDELIKKHINSYHPQVSHYTIAKAPQ